MLSGASAQTLGSSLAIQVLVLASGIVAARALGAEDRGHLAFFWLVPMTLSLLGGIGMPQATTYFVAKEPQNAGAVVGISIRISGLLALGLMLTYAIALLLPFSPNESELRTSGFLSVLLVPALISQAVGLAVLQGQQRFIAFNVVRVIAPGFYALGAVALYASGEASLETVMAVVLASWGIGAVVTWCCVTRNLPRSGIPASARPGEMLSFGARGVFGSVSPIDDLRVDQLLVGVLVDARALGLYVAAVAFCNLPRFIAQSIGLVAYPRIASSPSEQEAWLVVSRALKIGFWLVAASVSVLILIVPAALPFFFGSEFENAINLARILLFGTLFVAIRRLLTEICRGLGHPGYGSIGEAVSALLLVASALLIAPVAQEIGIAWSVAAVSAVSAAILGALLFDLHRRRERTEMLP